MRVRLVDGGAWRTKLFLWQAEQGSRRTRRHPRDDPRAEVGVDVGVGDSVSVSVLWNVSCSNANLWSTAARYQRAAC